jgi:hypothetical protein
MAQGFFDLKTPADMFQMLVRNLGRLKGFPGDVDTAYGFFVAAAHCPEWMKGEKYKKTYAANISQSDPQNLAHLPLHVTTADL